MARLSLQNVKYLMPKRHFDRVIRSLSSTQVTLLTLWVLLMISFPFVDWWFGREALQFAVSLGTLTQLLTVLLILAESWGVAQTFRIGILTFLAGWAAEALGHHTGFPFGAYSYTPALQPQILGVPIQIPMGWLMMLPPAWAVGKAIAGKLPARWQFPTFIGLSALAMTAWDLLMDPMMVSWGMWAWESASGYYGIPWSNFLGWLLVAALITWLIRPPELPIAPLLLIYTITWLLESVALILFWGLPGPGLVGGVIMGFLTLLAWRNT
jgi:putative membrane protein